jgi:hypothetical protein
MCLGIHKLTFFAELEFYNLSDLHTVIGAVPDLVGVLDTCVRNPRNEAKLQGLLEAHDVPYRAIAGSIASAELDKSAVYAALSTIQFVGVFSGYVRNLSWPLIALASP